MYLAKCECLPEDRVGNKKFSPIPTPEIPEGELFVNRCSKCNGTRKRLTAEGEKFIKSSEFEGLLEWVAAAR